MFPDLAGAAHDVYTRLKAWLSLVSGEVDFKELAFTVAKSQILGLNYAAAFAAVKADADKIFPDPITRPTLLCALSLAEAWFLEPAPAAH